MGSVAGSDGSYRLTTPFELPKGARKRVLPSLYLRDDYAPIIRPRLSHTIRPFQAPPPEAYPNSSPDLSPDISTRSPSPADTVLDDSGIAIRDDEHKDDGSNTGKDLLTGVDDADELERLSLHTPALTVTRASSLGSRNPELYDWDNRHQMPDSFPPYVPRPVELEETRSHASRHAEFRRRGAHTQHTNRRRSSRLVYHSVTAESVADSEEESALQDNRRRAFGRPAPPDRGSFPPVRQSNYTRPYVESDTGSPVRIRTASAGPSKHFNWKSAELMRDVATGTIPPQTRGRTFARLADVYEAKKRGRRGHNKSYSASPTEFSSSDGETPPRRRRSARDAASGITIGGGGLTPSLHHSKPIKYQSSYERAAPRYQGDDAFGATYAPNSMRALDKQKEFTGIHESKLRLIPENVRNLLLTSTNRNLIQRDNPSSIPRTFNTQGIDVESSNRCHRDLSEVRKNWGIPGLPQVPNVQAAGNSSTEWGDVMEFTTHTATGTTTATYSTAENAADQEKEPIFKDPFTYRVHRNRNTNGPPPNKSVDFKTNITRSYKDWGQSSYKQSSNWTGRLIEKAEILKKEGTIIPGLEESMRPMAFTTYKRVLDALTVAPITKQRVDVELYDVPQGLSFAEIQHALDGVGSLEWIRYNGLQKQLDLRFFYERCARRFSTDRNEIHLTFGDGMAHRLALRLGERVEINKKHIKNNETRRVKLGPIDLDTLAEIICEFDEAYDGYEDENQLVEGFVRAVFSYMEDISFAGQLNPIKGGKWECIIDFADIKDAVTFTDALNGVGAFTSGVLRYEADPYVYHIPPLLLFTHTDFVLSNSCQGTFEPQMLADVASAAAARLPTTNPSREPSTRPATRRGSVASSTSYAFSARSRNTNNLDAVPRLQLTDYERAVKRRNDLMNMQMNAQDEMQRVWDTHGARGLVEVFGAVPIRRVVRKRGF